MTGRFLGRGSLRMFLRHFKRLSILFILPFSFMYSSILVVPPSRETMHKVINSGYSHRSVPTKPPQELNSRAVPSVGGSITAQSVQPQGEIPEEGRKKTLLSHVLPCQTKSYKNTIGRCKNIIEKIVAYYLLQIMLTST